jgi:inner membrane protein
MKRLFSAASLSIKLWMVTNLVFGSGWFLYSLFFDKLGEVIIPIIGTICASVCSLPVLVILLIAIPLIEKYKIRRAKKILWLGILGFFCIIPYALLCGYFLIYSHDEGFTWKQYLLKSLFAEISLMACYLSAMFLSYRPLETYFSNFQPIISNQINTTMDTEQISYPQPAAASQHNKILVKGIITGALILLMLIPTMFVSNLVTEREERQQQVVKEVSSKWASKQTISGPYLYIPYTISQSDSTGKQILANKHLWVLPNNLNIDGEIIPETRTRSIYKVLLYKANLKSKGNFSIQIPSDINPSSLQLGAVKICYGISDFKGIEEAISINTNGNKIELSPGLPANDIDSIGLSAPIQLNPADLDKTINFTMDVKLKGSEEIHFLPLSGNSQFALHSTWNSPSFDGNNLPSERVVDEKGFHASWTFNKANLPFGTTLTAFNIDKKNYGFGVTMLQPADQYAKTTRSVKYAILLIGLSFSLFFIVELLQKKPVHPVQYTLVGLALVIFYSLLLSISEFLVFDLSYAIAAAATILLITLYAKGHFESWKTAGLFAAVLSGLYGFVFILIRLEDTALLVGSVGLFLVLALVMYASRKIKWYNQPVERTLSQAVPDGL